jgi:glutamate dehydrogenase
MEIIVEPRGKSGTGSDPAQKIGEALELLEGEVGREAFHHIRALAAVLNDHTSLSYLDPLKPREAADCLKAFFQFIDGRREEVAACFLPCPGKGQVLLLANSPDVPYLLDSLQNFLADANLRFQVVAHPILTVRRREGGVTELSGRAGEGDRESFIILKVEGLGERQPQVLSEALAALRTVLLVERDAGAIRQRLEAIEEIPGIDDYREFWNWLLDRNFLPFSAWQLRVEQKNGGEWKVVPDPDSILGLPPEPENLATADECLFSELEPAVRARMKRSGPVMVEETRRLSPIHRRERLVYLGIREPLGENAWREHAFLGLFSGKSLQELAFNISPLRQRIEKALQTLRIPPDCHDYRKTIEIFNTFPKVELFFMEPDELVRTIQSFTLLYRKGAVKVVPARSLAVRGLTLLVLMPRKFHTLDNISRIEAYLCRHFQSTSAVSRVIHISANYLSLHVGLVPGTDPVRVDPDRLERGLTRIAMPWEEKLQILLGRAFGEKKGQALWQTYSKGFSPEYRTLIHPRFALRDIRSLERVRTEGQEVMDFWGPFGRKEKFYLLQFYSHRESYLNELMPLLENLNLCVIDEHDFALRAEGRDLYVKSFSVRGISGSLKLSEQREKLLGALTALRRGEAENDYLNRLLVLTGLSWREIDVFRGYRSYYFQLGSPFTKRRVAFALINNPGVASLLYRYFEARFRPDPHWDDPLRREEEALFPVRQELATALEEVSDFNEDRILRTLFNLIDSTVRTNFFLRQSREDYFFSFKISAIGIIDMPAPRPLYEVYVHSATMEGIHLRGGKVARGGIRWSDRPDDFRTEILGLMKTQMTKNALIVPVGSKGGFIVKTPFSGREEGTALARAAYQTLMRGLLDLTDNRLEGQVRWPEGVVTYDEEDPYLVVAADKGTATFSDTANAISREYGYWLGDAFASGGSHGYDHKALGITARGAWECVKRHFREMDIDIQSQPFTVVGIGDMSGDVFGNGMLLSRRIRLLAAFDHRHIFLDPDPDPETSFKERERLFALPRSSWEDYDKSLISEGGGVFSRQAKDIPLSPQVRQWLDVRHESMDGPGLVRLLLTAEADLIWNGGIGTYVKASSEKHEEVGDRANDVVRVDARQLRARVVGEGGNLGFTQKARIEYALSGGRINTDAVDNSGGVDCSDHEVNLKILMQHLTEQGLIGSREERDALLQEFTGDVCSAVLANNYSQSLCLSLDAVRCAGEVEPHLDLSDRLVRAGLLDRKGEFLPSAKEVLARQGSSLTRPEFAILMAYAKMQLFQTLLDKGLPGGEGTADYLARYFPKAVRERFGKHLVDHPLAREILATVITNIIVDQAGAAFVNSLVRETGAPTGAVAEAYLAFDQVLDGESLRRSIFTLDNRMAASRQEELLLRLEGALAALCRWALRHGMDVRLEPETVASLREKALAVCKNLGGILGTEEWEKCKSFASSLQEEGLPAEIARTISTLPYLEDLLPLNTLAEKAGSDLYSAACSYNEVRNHLGIREVLALAEKVPLRDRWDRLAHQSLKEEFDGLAFDLTLAVLKEEEGNLEAYFAARRQKAAFYRSLQESLRGSTPVNFHSFTVLARALEALLV